MPVRGEPWPAGTPCWVDLAVPDPSAAAELYSSIFGWTVEGGDDEDDPFGGYRMATLHGHNAAGIGAAQAGMPPAWTVYVATDDIDATAAAVTDNGGTILAAPMAVPGMGSFLIAADPSGAAFGAWQGSGNIGAGVYNQPGGLVWTDTNVSDIGAARAFYAALFGWTFDEVPGAGEGYVTYRLGGDALGGLGGLDNFPAGTPSHWLPYLGTRDTDAAVGQFSSAGGTVVVPASDSPFGRMAVVTDPWGATVSLMSAPEEGYETGT